MLASGDVQTVYQSLVEIVQGLRVDFSKKWEYKTASVLHSYINFTYFYLQNEFLKQLKLAIVLKRKHANFELWLLGQTKEVQVDYWQRLRAFEWVNTQEMPGYSICETTLLEAPGFDNRVQLSEVILVNFELLSSRILRQLDDL